jgi:hypothetical protein
LRSSIRVQQVLGWRLAGSAGPTLGSARPFHIFCRSDGLPIASQTGRRSWMTSAPRGPARCGYEAPLTCGPSCEKSLAVAGARGRHRLRQACRHCRRGESGRPRLGHCLRRRLRHRHRRAPRRPDRRRCHHRRAALRSRRPLPRAHAGLLADIAVRGAVVSECPPSREPSRLRFHVWPVTDHRRAGPRHRRDRGRRAQRHPWPPPGTPATSTAR